MRLRRQTFAIKWFNPSEIAAEMERVLEEKKANEKLTSGQKDENNLEDGKEIVSRRGSRFSKNSSWSL